MEIFLSKQCESLTGSLGKRLGYHIQRRKDRFYGVRQSKGFVPPDGHLKFIFACAELAHQKLHVTDIKVDWFELKTALYEAKCFTASEMVRRNYTGRGKANYNAVDIINLKITFGL